MEFLYRTVAKPVLFRLDPEDVHDRVTWLGRMLGATPVTRAVTHVLLAYEDPILATTVAGIRFPNPVGLAAGFDKNARLTGILPDVGFGFAELGSITGQPCAGNPRPRLWRLKKSESLVVYYGLKNDGADAISARLAGARFRIPIGISAAKTNSPSTVDPDVAVADYAHVLERFRGIGDYFTVNISCPNAYGGEPFTDPSLLDRLLGQADALADKPIFLKLAVDLKHEQLESILAVCDRHRIAGFVCSNLTKNRTNHRIHDPVVPDVGGISGRAVQHLADEQVRYLYRRTRGRYAIMGVGGIFSAEDAYRKIRLGASLVQLITGMVFRGPQLIGQINRGLAERLRADGFASVAEAVGVDNAA
ncbi:MAG TPA: quinone-dependent dihydroorotate dehydrogenase [Candidatus Paceibacterota bacterium]|nr:quinone-dependent dihydroorotate dehydrogenase [Candidatus Paceibacterota bacterium]